VELAQDFVLWWILVLAVLKPPGHTARLTLRWHCLCNNITG